MSSYVRMIEFLDIIFFTMHFWEGVGYAWRMRKRGPQVSCVFFTLSPCLNLVDYKYHCGGVVRFRWKVFHLKLFPRLFPLFCWDKSHAFEWHTSLSVECRWCVKYVYKLYSRLYFRMFKIAFITVYISYIEYIGQVYVIYLTTEGLYRN